MPVAYRGWKFRIVTGIEKGTLQYFLQFSKDNESLNILINTVIKP